MGQRGQTGTSMIIQRKPINHTKKIVETVFLIDMIRDFVKILKYQYQ